MSYYGQFENDVYQATEKLIDKQAHYAWRFRHLKSIESKIANSILSSVLSVFVR